MPRDYTRQSESLKERHRLGFKPRLGTGKGTITEKGYRRIFLNGKNIREHRLVWEKNNGKIPEGCDVHHLNGIKTDNRIENLELIKHGEHSVKSNKNRNVSDETRKNIREKHWSRNKLIRDKIIEKIKESNLQKR